MGRRNYARDRHNGSNASNASQTAPRGAAASSDDRERSARMDQSGRSRSGDRMESEREDLLGTAQIVARHPLTALVASFSVGFGLGILATAIFRREEKGWAGDYYVPTSLRDVASSLRQVPDRIARHLPDSLTRG